MSNGQHQDQIITPHEHDVLSGRGNFVNYHAGNEHFRALVKKHKLAYVACPKPQKGKFSKMIVDEIKNRNPPGRFLKQDAKTKLWYDIGEKKALDKTRQALREGAPEIMKELTGDDDSSGDEGPRSSPHTPESGRGQKILPDVTLNGLHQGASVGSFGLPHLDTSPQNFDTFNNTQRTREMPQLMNAMSPLQQAANGYHYMARQDQILDSNGMMQFPAPLIPGQPLPSPHCSPQRVSQHNLPHPGMQTQFQQPMQRIDRPITSGIGLNGTQMGNIGLNGTQMGNMHGATYSEIDSLQTKLLNIGQQINTYNDYEPRHFQSDFTKPHEEALQLHDSITDSPTEDVGPLPKRKPTLKLIKRELKRDGSESSLQVDSIFTKSHDASEKTRMGNSSAHLSVMSLSIGDMGVHADPDSLAPLFNNSMRIGNRKPPRRTGSSDGTFPDMAQVMDMSVATLGDRMSEFGENSIARMTESQANMSFSNVFEDAERELCL